MAQSITVAEGAALINVAIVVVTLSFPLLVAVVTVGLLSNDTNAATWSVFSRLVNQSLWPHLLGTDTASSIKVDKWVKGMTGLSALATLILAVAAAFTPLGLHEITYLEESKDTLFTYIRDTSPIGRATPSRSGYSMNRFCGIQMSCPGNHDPYILVHNRTNNFTIPHVHREYLSVSTNIAANISEAFSSYRASDQTTVADVFDIQYRFYANYNDGVSYYNNNRSLIDNGRPRTQSQAKFYQDFIVDSRLQAIEGLIVSTTDRPGIGFRNHTLPPASVLGYTWTEHILWLEPETSCTNLNITLDYTMGSPDSESTPPKGALVDRGGFVELPDKDPILDLNNTQDDPQLLARSYVAAVMTNWILLKFSREEQNASYVGKEYKVDKYLKNAFIDDLDPLQIAFGEFAWLYFSSANPDKASVSPNLPPPLDQMMSSLVSAEQNLDSAYYIEYDVLYNTTSTSSISIAGTGGGILLGIGSPIDVDGNAFENAENARTDPNTKWSRPLYACVSAVKASVKNVEFNIEGEPAVKNLAIKSVNSIDYAKSTSTPPTWAMEDTGLPMNRVSPLWGIVSEDKKSSSGLSTLQRPEFYVPAGTSSLGLSLGSSDAVAGADAPLGAFSSIYGILNAYDEVFPKYLRGIQDWGLLMKWSSLGASAHSAGNIANYLWVDLLANNLVGSKSALEGPQTGDTATSALMPARQYKHGVGYDWRFAIAALLFAGLYLVMILWTIVLICIKRVTLKGLKSMLNQSAAGRSMTTERYQAKSTADIADTKTWAELRGGQLLRLSKNSITGVNSST